MRRVEVEIRGGTEGRFVDYEQCWKAFGRIGFDMVWAATIGGFDYTAVLAVGEFTDEQMQKRVLPQLRELRDSSSPPYRITARAVQEVATYSLDEPMVSQDIGKPPASGEAKADLLVPFAFTCGRDDGHD